MERHIDTPPNAPQLANGFPGVTGGTFRQWLSQIPLGVYGLVVGIFGLGLAAIPSIAMERSLPNPFETPEQALRRIDGPPRKKGGLTLSFKSFSINLGGKEVKNPVAPKPSLTNDPLRWLTIAATVCGLFGLGLCSVAHVREKQTAVTLTGIGCSIAAITWQFLVVGIVFGIAIVVILLILRVGFEF